MVSSGEYSDYSVDAVFTTKEAADATVAADPRPDDYTDGLSVEEIELYDAPVLPVPIYKLSARVYPDGRTEDVTAEVDHLFPWNWGYVSGRAEARMYRQYKDRKPDNVMCCVAGQDERAVRQSMSDRAARIKAEFPILWETLGRNGLTEVDA